MKNKNTIQQGHRQAELNKRRRLFPGTWSEHQALITCYYDEAARDFQEVDFS